MLVVKKTSDMSHIVTIFRHRPKLIDWPAFLWHKHLNGQLDRVDVNATRQSSATIGSMIPATDSVNYRAIMLYSFFISCSPEVSI